MWLSKKTNKYTYHDIQNECLKIMTLQILKKVCKNIQDSVCYSIMADQCTVISNQEQFTICIRSVSEDLQDHEDFIGLYEVAGIDADCLVQAIKDTLLWINVPHSHNVVANATMAHQICVGAGMVWPHRLPKRKIKLYTPTVRAPAEKNKQLKRKWVETWTHDFFCLADTAPKKCIAITECGDSANMHEEILSSFPALTAAGGYELMRVGERQRNKLEVIPVPTPSGQHTPLSEGGR